MSVSGSRTVRPMVSDYWTFMMRCAFLALEAQQVVVLRALRLGVGGAVADREVQRMVWEKLEAFMVIGCQAATAQAGGKSSAGVARGAVRKYRSRVRRNRRRLGPR